MSTLRISNIEAKADNSSPSVDEQLKITNSTGDVLLHLDGRTSGITTVGINTTAQTIKFDENNNVYITGIVTATELHGTVAVGTSVTYGDNEKAYFGTGLDLSIYHTGSHSYIEDTGTGHLYLDANQFYLRNNDSSNVLLQTTSGGNVQVKHNGDLRFETTNTGATVTGALNLTGASSGNYFNIGSSTVYANAAINIYRLGNGYADMRLSSNYGAKVALAGASNNTDEFYVQQDNQKNAYIVNEADKEMYFQTNSANRMTIAADGKIGVGVVAPVGTFEIRDSKANLIVAKDGLTAISNTDAHTTYDLIQLGAGGGLASYSTATATADTHLVHNAYRHSGGSWKYKYADTAMRLRMNSPGGAFIFDSAASGSAGGTISFSEKLRITSTGRIDILGDGGNAGFTLSNAYGQAGFFGGMYYNGSSWTRNAIGTRKGAGMYVNTGGHVAFLKSTETSGTSATVTESLRITSDGKVNVGGDFTQTSYQLSVTDTGGNLFRIKTSNEGDYDLRFMIQNSESNIWHYGTDDFVFGNRYDRKLHFITNAQKRLTINGNLVGINKTSPGASLHIGGPSEIRLDNAADAGNFARIRCFEESSDNAANLAFHVGSGEAIRIKNDGKILYGNHRNDRGAELQYEGSQHACIGIHRNTDTHGAPAMIFSASRGTSAGSNTVVQSGDYLGMLTFKGADGSDLASGAYITAIVDGTPGSNDMPARLGFWTSADGSQSPTERVRITRQGALHVGSQGELGNHHSGMFQVINTGGVSLTNDCLTFLETNSNDWIMKTNYNEANSTHYHIDFMEEGTRRGTIMGSNGSNVAFTPGSDYRWKENVIDLTSTEGIDYCKNLKPRKFNWIDNRINTGKINTVNGFIAHEVEEAGIGHLVFGEKDAVNEDGSINGQTLDYAGLTPILAAAVKGLIAKVETLEAEVAALKSS